ncbi:MAG: DNA mismatch repair protein MutS [Bacteroidota bacterium]
MKQYNAIKGKYPGALLLFRVGDFYETFGEDAVTASNVLDIVLTKRANGAASHIELAGFPHHSLDSYLPRLVRAGYRVAICDQLEDPKSVKGIVKRGVTEMVTPGLSFNENVLDRKRNNYLAAICCIGDWTGISFLDLSTGEFLSARGSKEYIEKLIQGFQPTEVLYNKRSKTPGIDVDHIESSTFGLEDWVFAYDFAYEKLTNHFKTKNLKGFGIEGINEGIISAGAILQYLEDTEHKEVKHISSISRIEEEKYVWLDRFTIRNLELLYPSQPGGIPLIDILDRTTTAMGARLLRKWMVLPLKDKNPIEERLKIVEALSSKDELKSELGQALSSIGDLERLASKVAVGRVNPRELILLKKSLIQIPIIKSLLESSGIDQLKKVAVQLNACTPLAEKIESELKDDPPLNPNQGNLIKDGIDEELDDLRSIAFSGKDHLLQIQKRESEKTGISSLKIAYNKVFGYYLEVTHAHKDKVPSEWIRKQTLVNAERYITEELKEYEEKILHAEGRLSVLEKEIYDKLVFEAGSFLDAIQLNAKTIAFLDCLLSFATNAQENNYCKPQIEDHKALNIKEGRHPVIEKQMPAGENYVPNDVFLDNDESQILIITGPNMAGKSALLRQTALITLMAQIGSFVPAKSAEIGLIDKVFTRVGASDNLSKGESTFMVEMTETASILNNLSDRSLILMDEIGRGTSTYDGISIAWSIIEFLHNHPKFKPKTLFATHYHELNQLEGSMRGVKNFNVSVKEVGKKVLFMRKLKEGGSAHSFGIHVAQMAGMPNPVIIRSNEILLQLEKNREGKSEEDSFKSIQANNVQLNLFEPDPRFLEFKKLLDNLDINTISPVEALLKLNEIQTLFRSEKEL